MKSPKTVHTIAVAILVAAFLARAVSFLSVHPSCPSCILQPDSGTYENPALAILKLGKFTTSPDLPDRPEAVRTPGYPIFIALVYGIFGKSHIPLILAQILVSIGTLALTFVLARKLWNEAAALVALMLLALDPASFIFSQILLSETLFAFLLLLAAWLGTKVVESPGAAKWQAVSFSLALAAAAFVRPVGQYIIWPILIGLLFRLKSAKVPVRELLLTLLLVALPFLALVGGWKLRNNHLVGTSSFSMIEDYNLLWYRGAGVISERDKIPFEAAQEKIRASLQDVEAMTGPDAAVKKFAIYRTEGLTLIRSHPALVLKSSLKGLAKMMLGPAGSEIRRFYGFQVGTSGPAGDLLRLPFKEYFKKWVVGNPTSFIFSCLLAVYFLVLYFGMALSIPAVLSDSANRWSHALVIGILLYMIALSSGPEAYARFRVPIMPLLTIYAAPGLLVALSKIRSRMSASKACA